MPTVALVSVHGMGETPRNYAAEVFGQMRSRLGPDLRERLACYSVYYQDILQKNEQLVWNRVDRQSKVHYDELRKFMLFGFADAAGLENRKEIPGSVYELAQGEIARNLLGACTANHAMPVVFLAHSLGCQVLSSYLYDAQKARAGGRVEAGVWRDIDGWARMAVGRVLSEREKLYLAGGTCSGLMTTGCNIPIFVAAHRNMQIKPIAPPTPIFHWLNLYDPDDVLGWPLQPLSEDYRVLVEDRAINAGQGAVNWMLKSWNPLSHSAYWQDNAVLAPLAGMIRRMIE
ncbi:hypothetical protein QPK31_14885 [Massilia sp. YIM B02769]|uniref:hypothetical protein n=1 Tax=Massilia sp. YIM B02769 TaxID=3050129 RepID=UPI0025B6559A|nr:hypothetical protein [Massilia sp. YIM B02769]MDN4059510.1 hypothetical protein [Massilia sp. YIM B02769]